MPPLQEGGRFKDAQNEEYVEVDDWEDGFVTLDTGNASILEFDPDEAIRLGKQLIETAERVKARKTKQS